MGDQIKLALSGSVATLNIGVKPINALNEDALNEIDRYVSIIEYNEEVKSIIIKSSIKSIFCTGGDLKYWPKKYPKKPEIVSSIGQKLFNRIEMIRTPSIAAIDGMVIGDGISLALACDIRIASPNSVFQLPEVDYGFIPGWGTVERIINAGGKTVASELLLLGSKISAEKAKMYHLINYIKSSDEVIPYAKSLAKALSNKPKYAMGHAKKVIMDVINNQSKYDNTTAYDSFTKVWGGKEWEDGIKRLFASNDE